MYYVAVAKAVVTPCDSVSVNATIISSILLGRKKYFLFSTTIQNGLFLSVLPNCPTSSTTGNFLFSRLNMIASRGAGAQSVTVKWTGCGFDSRGNPRKCNIYLYFNFFAPVSRQKRGGNFRYSTRKSPEFDEK